MDTEWTPQGIDTTQAHPARRYNYWLGGKDNFDQFLDIGTGLPSAGNVHEIA